MKFLIPVLIILAVTGYFFFTNRSEPVAEIEESYSGNPEEHTGDKTLLVAVYAKWASTWPLLADVLAGLDREKYDIQLIDADEDPGRVKALEVEIIPTVVVYENGQETDRLPNLTIREKVAKSSD